MLSDAETTASLSSVGGSGGRRRKALVICIDGCRADVLQVAAAGFVRDVLKVPGCSFTFHARCDDVPVSYPSWSSMWTGVGQAAHGVEDNFFLGGPAAPSALHRVKAHSPVTSTSFHCSGWWGLRNIFSRRGDDAPEASTFAWTDTDVDHVRGVVDEMRSYGADVIARKNGYGPGEYPGDEKAVAAQAAAIEAGEAADLSVIYLYDCDRVGHRDGFGPQVDTYVEAVRIMAEKRVRVLLDAVAARRDAAADTEEWMVLVGTDHGGSARQSMDTATNERFDALRDGNAYGQRGYEGVHGAAWLRAHTTTFLLVLVPPHVDPGGEILDDDVKNSDVTVTLCHWFGVEHEDLTGKARGVGLGKDTAEGFFCDQSCCAEDIVASAERKRMAQGGTAQMEEAHGAGRACRRLRALGT